MRRESSQCDNSSSLPCWFGEAALVHQGGPLSAVSDEVLLDKASMKKVKCYAMKGDPSLQILNDLECLNVIKKSRYHYGHLGDENYVLSLMGCVHILRETTRFRVIASPSIWHSFMFQTLYSIYLCSPSTSLTSNHFSLIIQS